MGGGDKLGLELWSGFEGGADVEGDFLRRFGTEGGERGVESEAGGGVGCVVVLRRLVLRFT